MHLNETYYTVYNDCTTHLQLFDIMNDRPTNPHLILLKIRTATTHIKRQLISGDNSYQFGKATTHINQNSYQKIYSK